MHKFLNRRHDHAASCFVYVSIVRTVGMYNLLTPARAAWFTGKMRKNNVKASCNVIINKYRNILIMVSRYKIFFVDHHDSPSQDVQQPQLGRFRNQI